MDDQTTAQAPTDAPTEATPEAKAIEGISKLLAPTQPNAEPTPQDDKQDETPEPASPEPKSDSTEGAKDADLMDTAVALGLSEDDADILLTNPSEATLTLLRNAAKAQQQAASLTGKYGRESQQRQALEKKLEALVDQTAQDDDTDEPDDDGDPSDFDLSDDDLYDPASLKAKILGLVKQAVKSSTSKVAELESKLQQREQRDVETTYFDGLKGRAKTVFDGDQGQERRQAVVEKARGLTAKGLDYAEALDLAAGVVGRQALAAQLEDDREIKATKRRMNVDPPSDSRDKRRTLTIEERKDAAIDRIASLTNMPRQTPRLSG